MSMNTEATVWIVDADQPDVVDAANMVHIPDIGLIFSAVDLDQTRAANWFAENGLRTVDGSDAAIVPKFPMISKLFWVIVDPATFVGDEVEELSLELLQAQQGNILSSDKELLDRIRRLTERAGMQGRSLAVSHT